MTTETTNIGPNTGGRGGPAGPDAFGSTNWEERLAAAREKRLQVLEERRKSGDFVADAPAIVGPKPWEVGEQTGSDELSFVEEFEPDEFDYEKTEKPEDLETIVLPLSAAVSASDREIDLLAEDDDEELDEEKSGHLRAVAFIGVGAVMGIAFVLGSGLFVRPMDIPPDFVSGSTIDSSGAEDVAANSATATAIRPEVTDPEIALVGTTTTASAAPQPTIESLSSDISDDIVAVAVETTRAVTEDPNVLDTSTLSTGELSQPVLATGNTDRSSATVGPSDVAASQTISNLPGQDIPQSLSFPDSAQADQEVSLTGVSNLTVPSETASVFDFNLDAQIETDLMPQAPSIADPEGSGEAVASASELSDAETNLPTQGRLVAAGLSVTSPNVETLANELFGGVVTDVLPNAPSIIAPQIVENLSATSSPLTDVGTNLPSQNPLIASGLSVTAPSTATQPDVPLNLLGQAPAISEPSEGDPVSLPGLATSAPAYPTTQALAGVETASNALPEASPAPQRSAEAEMIAIEVAAPRTSLTPTTLPGIDPASQPHLQLAAVPNSTYSEAPAALASPDPRGSIIRNLETYTVRMHVPSAVPEDNFAGRVETLRTNGLTLSTARVDFKISNDQIRFFHAEDAPMANAIAGEIGGTVRDFTDFSPSPPAGTVEIWLSGDSAKPAKPVRAKPKTTRRTTTNRAPARQRRVDPAEALRQQLTRRLRRGDHL